MNRTPRRLAARPALLALTLSLASVVSAAPANLGKQHATAKPAATPPIAPVVTLRVFPQKLRLQWAATAGAQHYRVYEKPAAGEPFRQVGQPLHRSTTQKEIGLSAHTHAWADAQYVVAACNRAGCTRSARATTKGQLVRAVEVLTSDYELHVETGGPRNQQYGGQIALSGDGRTLAVADLWYFGGSEWPWYGSGAVYVYGRAKGSWALQAKLEPPSARGYDFFGSDIALSTDGNVLAVGAQTEGYDAPSQDAGPGSVFVFTRRSGAWAQQAMIRASSPQDAAWFGRSIELSGAGNVLAVGAPYASSEVDGAVDSNAGAVYVFKRKGSTWAEQAALQAPSPQSDDLFGLGVRLSEDGRTVAALAAEQNPATEDTANGGWPNRNNTLYVFSRTGEVWTLDAQIEATLDDPLMGGNAYEPEGQAEGFDLSADGRTLAVASPFASGPDAGAGVIRLYRRQSGVWAPTGLALAPSIADRRSFGARVTLSADGRMLVATADRDDGAFGHPYVIVFARKAGQWSQISALESPGAPNASGFANALALSWSGKRLALGARAFATESSSWGATLVY